MNPSVSQSPKISPSGHPPLRSKPVLGQALLFLFSLQLSAWPYPSPPSR